MANVYPGRKSMTIYVNDDVYFKVRELAANQCVTVSKFVEKHLTRLIEPKPKHQTLRQHH